MYHEEKMINGVLHWRGTPDGEFKPYTVDALSERVKRLEDECGDLRAFGEAARRRMNEAADFLRFESDRIRAKQEAKED